MSKYLNELKKLQDTAQTDNALLAGLLQIQKKYHITDRVIKTLKNGIKLIGVYDKDDNLINQYHA